MTTIINLLLLTIVIVNYPFCC